MKNISKTINLSENEIYRNLFQYKEYYLIKDYNVYKFRIVKRKRDLIINCNNYEVKLNYNDLSIITKSLFNTLDDSFEFIINIFEENKAKIKEISFKKTIKLLLKIYIYNQEKDIEIILVYNKENRDLIINEINNKYNILKNDIKVLKDEINILKQEIYKLKISNNNSIPISKEKHLNNKKNNSNPKEIYYSKDIVIDSYANFSLDNTFITFKSKHQILYLVYSNKNKSIISYDIINNKKVKEIKNAHDEYIINFRYYFDKIYKEDLILSISSDDNNMKLWSISNWNILLNLKNINSTGWMFSACFLNNNNNNYILTSNSFLGPCEPIKVFDFKGNKIKEINDSNEKTYFIDTYYDNIITKNFIITGNNGYVKSYDYDSNRTYHKYNDNKDNTNELDHYSIIINDKEEIIKLIESSRDGNIRIWNFHSGLLLQKINIGKCKLYGICLWNNKYLFVGCNDKNIKLIDLNNGTIIKDLNGHNNKIVTIKKIIHPQYGESLITQNYGNSSIKLWI